MFIIEYVLSVLILFFCPFCYYVFKILACDSSCNVRTIWLLEIVYPTFYSPLPLERGKGVRLSWRGVRG